MADLSSAISKAMYKMGKKKPIKKKSKLDAAMDKCGKMMMKSMDLKKGIHDAMAYHAMAAKASNEARYKPNEIVDLTYQTKLDQISKKHEFMMLRHALENARKKAKYCGDMKWKLQRTVDFFNDDVASYDDPEFIAMKEYYAKGGAYKGHADDKFKEDY